jgi:hypothetical protein
MEAILGHEAKSMAAQGTIRWIRYIARPSPMQLISKPDRALANDSHICEQKDGDKQSNWNPVSHLLLSNTFTLTWTTRS